MATQQCIFLSSAYKRSQENQHNGQSETAISDELTAVTSILDAWRGMMMAGIREWLVDTERSRVISKMIRRRNW